jgi:hypothetical protein
MTVTGPTQGNLTPPGWYPDPYDASGWRYWDGAQWTQQRSSAQTAPSPAGFSPWAKAAAVVVAVALVAGMAWWATSGSDRGGGQEPTTTTTGVADSDGDAAVRAGVDAIAQACSSFAGYYGYGPSVDDVLPGGAVSDFLDAWPTNPYTGGPMTQGGTAGDFTFNTAIEMPDGGYSGYVTGLLADGETYSVEFRY